MEAISLHPVLRTAGGRHPSNGGARQDMQGLERDATHAPPRKQPVDIVIPSVIPSPREDHVLEVVQQPEIAKVAAAREKGEFLSPSPCTICHLLSIDSSLVRTPLDPPLVVELSFKSQESNRCAGLSPYNTHHTHYDRTYLSSPFFFGNVELVPEHPPVPAERRQFQSAMIGGSLVSSLHKVRLEDNLGELNNHKKNSKRADYRGQIMLSSYLVTSISNL